jgi:antitoxin CcdA
MENTFHTTTTNIRISTDLHQQALKYNIDLSVLLEKNLRKIFNRNKRDLWIHENMKAMQEANQFVSEHGRWSDNLRVF